MGCAGILTGGPRLIRSCSTFRHSPKPILTPTASLPYTFVIGGERYDCATTNAEVTVLCKRLGRTHRFSNACAERHARSRARPGSCIRPVPLRPRRKPGLRLHRSGSDGLRWNPSEERRCCPPGARHHDPIWHANRSERPPHEPLAPTAPNVMATGPWLPPAEDLNRQARVVLRHAVYGHRNGLKVYESLRNLNEVIGTEYGDRVLYELIQNAHDAHRADDRGPDSCKARRSVRHGRHPVRRKRR